MQLQSIVRPEGEAVPLDWKAPPLIADILNRLQNNRFQTPVNFGGFLRDSFKEVACGDIDILMKTPDMKEEEILQHLREAGIEAPYPSGTYQALFQEQAFKGFFQGYEVDIHAVSGDFNAHAAALYGDATINRIAVGTDGQVFADPSFVHDLENGIYRVIRREDEGRSAARCCFFGLQQKLGIKRFISPKNPNGINL